MPLLVLKHNGTDNPWTHSHLFSDTDGMSGGEYKNSKFGDAVRNARLSAGLTQEDLADRSGLDRSYIGGVERGERNPTLSVIEKIAFGLGVPLRSLFDYDSDQEGRT